MEFYKTATSYLQKCNIQISAGFLRQRMQSHPDYPSLVSFTDTLDEVGLAYSAIIADKGKYFQLHYPLLAHVKHNGIEDFILVSTAAVFENNKQALLNQWSGIVVIVESGLSIHYQEHNAWLRNEKIRNRQWLTAALVIITLLLSNALYYFTATDLLLTLLSIAGIGICSQIILHGMGKNNNLTEQLCSGDGNHGCDKVLQSKAAILWKGIGLGDAGLVYFTGICLFLFLASINKAGNNFIILLLPFLVSFLLSVFSIWYQWRIVKSWCKMCLIVSAIIWLQLLALLTIHNSRLTNDDFTLIASFFLISLIVPGIAWFVIKPLILKVEEGFKNEISLLKLKRNPDVFFSLLYKQRKADITIWEDDIILGNRNAPIKVIVACNPYCGPCATAHRELEELLTIYQEIVCIIVRFVVSSTSKEDKRRIAVEAILTAYDVSSKDALVNKQVIDDWYQCMDLDKFKNIYDITTSSNYDDLLIKHKNWYTSAHIIYTPTIFINSYEVPAQYRAKDLKLLITPIIENNAFETVVTNAEK